MFKKFYNKVAIQLAYWSIFVLIITIAVLWFIKNINELPF